MDTVIAYRWFLLILAFCIIGFIVSMIRSHRRNDARDALNRGMNIRQAQDYVEEQRLKRRGSLRFQLSVRLPALIAGIALGLFFAAFLSDAVR